MKAESKIIITKKPKEHERTEFKAVAVSVWTPQPNPLTRAEIRKIVLGQIG
jgi:hypothetical protein